MCVDKEQDGENSKQGAGVRWTTPERGVIKINTDAAFNQSKDVAGWGIVARDDSGKLVSAWAGKENKHSEPAIEEATAELHF